MSNRVLSNIDILWRIFKNSHSSQNYYNALVSKIWSNEALGVLWRTLDSLLPLLRLLGPMTLVLKQDELPYYKYERLIRSDDWVVFWRYASRVRKIEYHDMSPHPKFSDSVFMDIIISSRTLSGVDLLPNLQRLSSDDTPLIQKWLPLFISKSLSALDLQASASADMHLLSRTLLHLPHLCPNLRNLSLLTEIELDDAPQFDATLSSLPLLNEVKLSTSLLCLATMNTLAHLPHLESFTITTINMIDGEFTLPVMPLPEAFPSLRTFSSETVGFCSIVTFLETYKPRELRTLDVYSISTESYATYQSLFAAVTSTCPEVKNIRLQLLLVIDIEAIVVPSPPPLLSIIPFHLLDLTTLELICPPPLNLDVGCMKALLAALPSLVTLELSESTGPPTLPLSALSELAPLCPVMRSLSLSLDTKHIAGSAPPDAIFPCLEVLDVLSSPLESPARNVAMFLGSILPPKCVVRHSHYGDQMKWGPVVDFLPLVFELRLAKQAYINAITPRQE
ncbi:F-box domain-containing protein [Pleurotus pulmonarius]